MSRYVLGADKSVVTRADIDKILNDPSKSEADKALVRNLATKEDYDEAFGKYRKKIIVMSILGMGLSAVAAYILSRFLPPEEDDE